MLHEPTGARVMVVDDTPENLKLLETMLLDRGYRVQAFPRGELALNAASRNPPDLILLDITMPGMNGYEVCERLKADPRLQDIPVIFISGLAETTDKVKAFSTGGVDYVTKPIQFEEVEARVETHLRLRRLQSQIEERNRQLQESCDRLTQLEALRDSLTHMIVHDMRTPLTVTQLALQVFLMTYGTSLDAKGVGILRRALASGETLIEMVSSLLDISRMEAGEMPLDITRCDVAALLREAWERVEPLRGHREFALEAPETAVVAPCDAGLIGRVTQNLLANALKFAPDNSAVQAGVLARDETCDVYVRDSGQGIPAAYHQRIFEKFGQVETRATGQVPSTGLGLAFCKLAVEAHGGRIWVESEEGQGSIFWFTLPVARV